MNVQLTSMYTQNGMNLAHDVYRFPEMENNRNRTNAYRYLFMYLDRQNEITYDELVNTVIVFMNNEIKMRKDTKTILELLDILMTYAPTYSNNILHQVRDLNIQDEPVFNRYNPTAPPIEEEYIPEDDYVIKTSPKDYRDKDKTKKYIPAIQSVYTDSQNVHNDDVANSCTNVIDRLYELTRNDIIKLETEHADSIIKNRWFLLKYIEHKLCIMYSRDTDIINKTISYIGSNIGIFGNQRLTLETIFISLFVWINSQSEDKRKQLFDRMIEEFYSMRLKCSSGHTSRLMNVIQGYTDDPQLCITISNFDRYTSIISNYINKKLQETKNEDVLNGICDHNEVYIKFIKSIVNDKIEEWSKEVSINEIHAIVNKHLYYDVYSDKPIKKRVSYCGIM